MTKAELRARIDELTRDIQQDMRYRATVKSPPERSEIAERIKAANDERSALLEQLAAN